MANLVEVMRRLDEEGGFNRRLVDHATALFGELTIASQAVKLARAFGVRPRRPRHLHLVRPDEQAPVTTERSE